MVALYKFISLLQVLALQASQALAIPGAASSLAQLPRPGVVNQESEEAAQPLV